MNSDKPHGPRFAPPRSAFRAKPKLETDCFVALDFETADYGQDSACSIALIRIENHAISHREHRLIRPPPGTFVFRSLHGISWDQVAHEPLFKDLWPQIRTILDGARFIAAHNASFDANVMRACCGAAGLPPPEQPFLCTVKLARKTWGIRPTKLPDVCRHLGLPLNHHDALSDAEACANIVLAAIRDGAL
jgi:DNA polymerase III subunit epsilon